MNTLVLFCTGPTMTLPSADKGLRQAVCSTIRASSRFGIIFVNDSMTESLPLGVGVSLNHPSSSVVPVQSNPSGFVQA